MRIKFPILVWGFVILYAVNLILLMQINYDKFSLLQLSFHHDPNISHLRIFICEVYAPIAPSQHTKMDPQKGWEYIVRTMPSNANEDIYLY